MMKKWLRFAVPAVLVLGLAFTGPIACAPSPDVFAANERLDDLSAQFEAAMKATPQLASLAMDARQLDRMGAQIIQMRISGIVTAVEFVMIEPELTNADKKFGIMYDSKTSEGDRADARASFNASMERITRWHDVWRLRIPG